MSLHIIVTGVAGFIGSNLTKRLLDLGFEVTGIDNFDPFYDLSQKKNNLKPLLNSENFHFYEGNIEGISLLLNPTLTKFDAIIHLAAKAGVRPSIEHPISYLETNVIGTQQVLEFAKNNAIRKFIFASSSSVYGINPHYPWLEKDANLFPISPYAASKISSELMGHVYSTLYDIQFLAIRFFTVYGPSQRPDLAIHKFFNKIYRNEKIDLFGDGTTERDYTYIDDIIAGLVSALFYEKTNYEIINLGNQHPVKLKELIEKIEVITEQKALINYLPEQSGDVSITYANINKAKALLNYEPKTSLDEGLCKFNEWYKTYYNMNLLTI